MTGRLPLIFLGLLTSWQAYAAETLPRAFTAVYTLKRDEVELGEMKRSLTPTRDGKFIYESITRATGWVSWVVKDEVVERSTWTYTNARIRPLEYSYDRSRGRSERRVHLSFDWTRNIVTNNVGGDAWRMPIPDDALDKLVYQLSIMLDMQRPKPELIYRIADGGALKTYQFTVLAQEDVTTPAGRFRTIKIERVGDKRDTTVWMAPRLLYLPVRLEQTDKDGTTLSMHLNAFTGIPLR